MAPTESTAGASVPETHADIADSSAESAPVSSTPTHCASCAGSRVKAVVPPTFSATEALTTWFALASEALSASLCAVSAGCRSWSGPSASSVDCSLTAVATASCTAFSSRAVPTESGVMEKDPAPASYASPAFVGCTAPSLKAETAAETVAESASAS